ncbi:acyl-[acyl-carrier-protein] thioesterase [Saccharibacillus sacchari]|uniref:Acyl-ACP thioesterase domain-containing protein n=1 Tax=Saccharibacillus sacchari TaxID=456493 RepID=A0ACC6PJY7_9BACL
MQDVWTESFVATVTESDFAGRVRPSAILAAMQNAADRHLEDAGVPVTRLLERGLAWVLMTAQIQLETTPRQGESLKLETWNAGASGVLWTRDYRLLRADGVEAMRASTAWTLVDIARRRILRPSAFPFPLPVSSRASLSGSPEKVSIPDTGIEWSEPVAYTVPYSAVDCYGHMNNARYADLCTDLMTPEQLRHFDLASLRITYSQEAAMGERIQLRCGQQGSQWFVFGQTEKGRKMFEAISTLRAKVNEHAE